MIKALCRTWNDKEVKNIKKERTFNNVKLYKEKETSKSSFESETGTLLNMLKHGTSKNDEKINQVMKLRIWAIRKWRQKRRSYTRQYRNTKDHETTIKNYMLIKWTTCKKWTNS